MSRLDEWLVRAAAVCLILLALYAYSWALLDHVTWKIQVTQAINALSQAAKGPAPLALPPRPAENTSPK
jgi:hypothetical protein